MPWASAACPCILSVSPDAYYGRQSQELNIVSTGYYLQVAKF